MQVEDPYLDTNRAVLCVENILEQLGKRRLVITDLHSHFHMKITTTKEMLLLWNTYRENVIKVSSFSCPWLIPHRVGCYSDIVKILKKCQ